MDKNKFQVVNLHSKSSEHNDVWKGQEVYLDIDRFDNGFAAHYKYEHTAEPMGPGGPVVSCSHSVCTEFVRWYRWFGWFGYTRQKAIDRVIRRLKRRWTDYKEFYTLREQYGVGPGIKEEEDG